jgi:hypothetical protein
VTDLKKLPDILGFNPASDDIPPPAPHGQIDPFARRVAAVYESALATSDQEPRGMSPETARLLAQHGDYKALQHGAWRRAAAKGTQDRIERALFPYGAPGRHFSDENTLAKDTDLEQVAVTQINRRREANLAFDNALRIGALSSNKGASNYIGDFMYMGHDTAGRALFKNYETRDYLPPVPYLAKGEAPAAAKIRDQIADELRYAKRVLIGVNPTDEQRADRQAAIDDRLEEFSARRLPLDGAAKTVATKDGLIRLIARPTDLSDALAISEGRQLVGQAGAPRTPSDAATVIAAFADALVTGRATDGLAAGSPLSLETLATAPTSNVAVVSFDAERMTTIVKSMSDPKELAASLTNAMTATRAALVECDQQKAMTRDAARNKGIGD